MQYMIKSITNFLKRLIPLVILNKIFFLYQFFKALKNSFNTKFYSEKIISNKQIKIVFIINFVEAWSTVKPIYERLIKQQINVYILCQPDLFNTDWQSNNSSYRYLSKIYRNVINAYEDNWYNLEMLKPDYVFYVRPYNTDYYEKYRSSYVRKYAKVCLISYGYNLEHSKDHNFNVVNNFDFLQNCYFVFTTTNYEKKVLNKRFFISKLFNLPPYFKFFGYPRFDLDYEIKPGIKKTILYTPRWTSELKKKNQTGSFLKYIHFFENFAKANPDKKIIIRPHPLMFNHYIQNNLVESDYFEKLENRFKLIGNIFIDRNMNYMDALTSSDLYISDYSSLLIEYFITKKPVIYLGNSTLFNKEFKKVEKCFYHANNSEQIEEQISKAFNNKNVINKNYQKIYDKIFRFRGKSSDMIIECIKEDFQKGIK